MCEENEWPATVWTNYMRLAKGGPLYHKSMGRDAELKMGTQALLWPLSRCSSKSQQECHGRHQKQCPNLKVLCSRGGEIEEDSRADVCPLGENYTGCG